MKIDKNRTYTTRDGRAVRIYATDGGASDPVHGAVKGRDGWSIYDWKGSGRHQIHLESCNDLIEALKPNGIPVDLPDPIEVEGYTWEARGWGWNSNHEPVYYDFCTLEEDWTRYHSESTASGDPSQSDIFYVEYIPIRTEEMTLEQVCKKLGKTIKIIK